jgi:hypothetical protein
VSEMSDCSLNDLGLLYKMIMSVPYPSTLSISCGGIPVFGRSIVMILAYCKIPALSLLPIHPVVRSGYQSVAACLSIRYHALSFLFSTLGPHL